MPRSDVPAITHVDYSARVQTVDRGAPPRYCTGCSTAFDEQTGCPVLDQHQLQRPRRADRLHAGGRLPLLHAHRHGRAGARGLRLLKEEQPPLAGAEEYKRRFKLD